VFLPTTKEEITALGWDRPDVILVTGDSYIDSPYIGAAVIGRVLERAGFRVAVMAQPDVTGADPDQDIRRLGEPALFWGVTGGSVDSLVANWTATGKKRQQDDYTPGGINNRRPDRAVIVYANLIRSRFKATAPIFLGGIEASLRRVSHYDYWDNRIRRSILFDAKADYLLYGMAERGIVELAKALRRKDEAAIRDIRGLCYPSQTIPEGCLELPSHAACAENKDVFTQMFRLFYQNNDPVTAVPLAQKQDSRYLIQNPPAHPLTPEELDAVHELPYARDVHPYYKRQGNVRALDTIRFSITTHRGCYGECNYCAIAVHQGRRVVSRSPISIVAEAQKFTKHPAFKGIIADVGGPTANMYGIDCPRKTTKGSCPDKRCLFPKPCPALPMNHKPQIDLLEALRKVPGVRKIVVASGIRYDMILADTQNGVKYLNEVICHHVSGQMKIAPEHTENHVLEKMGKPGPDILLKFKGLFDRMTRSAGLEQFLTYYLIAAHPGCTSSDMENLRAFSLKHLGILPEQVQIFTPTPSTYSTLMYWTGKNPFTGAPCFVEKSIQGREKQKEIIMGARGKKPGKTINPLKRKTIRRK